MESIEIKHKEGIGIPELIKEINRVNSILRKRQEIHEENIGKVQSILMDLQRKTDKVEDYLTRVVDVKLKELDTFKADATKKLDLILKHLNIDPNSDTDKS